MQFPHPAISIAALVAFAAFLLMASANSGRWKRRLAVVGLLASAFLEVAPHGLLYNYHVHTGAEQHLFGGLAIFVGVMALGSLLTAVAVK